MNKLNYLESKLLLFFSSQYEKDTENKIAINASNISQFMNAGANGYVIVPLYDIRNITDANLNSMVEFIDLVYNKNKNCKLWLGTPSISSNTYVALNNGIYSQLANMNYNISSIKKHPYMNASTP